MNTLRNPLAWLTGVTALVAVCIAYQQYRTSQHRLRLELFDRRWAVYSAVMEVIATALINNEITHEQYLHFRARTNAAEFLFDASVTGYLEQVGSHVRKLQQLNRRIASVGGIRHSRSAGTVDERDEVLDWFEACQDDGARIFGRYLNFRDVY